MNSRLVILALALTTTGCAAGTSTGPRAASRGVAARPVPVAAQGTCVTVQRAGASGAAADTRIAEAWPEQNYGEQPAAFAGNVGSASRLMLLRFDLDSVPANARITKATITLHRQTCGCSSVTVHRATNAWDEKSVTWRSFANNFEPEPGAILPDGFDGMKEDGFGAVTFDSTDLVRGWHDGTAPNLGIVLAQEHTNTTFATSEWDNVDERPRLDVCFEAKL